MHQGDRCGVELDDVRGIYLGLVSKGSRPDDPRVLKARLQHKPHRCTQDDASAGKDREIPQCESEANRNWRHALLSFAGIPSDLVSTILGARMKPMMTAR